MLFQNCDVFTKIYEILGNCVYFYVKIQNGQFGTKCPLRYSIQNKCKHIQLFSYLFFWQKSNVSFNLVQNKNRPTLWTQKFKFSPKNRILPKKENKLFGINPNFLHQSKCCHKIQIFSKNQTFLKKSFSPKIKVFAKISICSKKSQLSQKKDVFGLFYGCSFWSHFRLGPF